MISQADAGRNLWIDPGKYPRKYPKYHVRQWASMYPTFPKNLKKQRMIVTYTEELMIKLATLLSLTKLIFLYKNRSPSRL